MGLEGESSAYRKLKDVDTFDLVESLQSNGIKVLGSSIIGLETHTPETIGAAIDHAVAHNTVFHQFMLYTPNPGTPLYESHKRAGTLIPDFPVADTHGQYRFNYRHPAIKNGEESGFLLDAFRKDFDVNGPSLARLIRVTLDGYLKHRSHPDPRVRERYEREVAPLKTTYAGAVWAMKAHYKGNEAPHLKMKHLLSDIYAAFGLTTRMVAPVVGRYLLHSLRKEERRLEGGMTMEPACFYERNEAARTEHARPVDAKDAPIGLEPVGVRVS